MKLDGSNQYKCPKCNSKDVIVGAYLLSCVICGWNHNNEYPCTVCGKPSYSSCSDGERGEKVYHGCKEHSAIEFYRKRIEEKNKNGQT